MSAATEAFVTPDVIIWARERIGASHEQIAVDLSVKPRDILAWETGTEQPSFKEALNLAYTLRIPFGYLFLSKPPEDEAPVPDLRTRAGAPPLKPSANLLDTVEDALRKQHWYREVQEEDEAKALPFVGKFSLRDSVEAVAADIRDVLQVNDELRRESPSWADFFRSLLRNAELAGILVLRSGTAVGHNRRPLDPSEFQGFALSDPYAPIVFVNTRDVQVAQIFTFAHEVVHIWINETGISRPDLAKKSSEQINRVESFCNRVAAEVLVPSKEFARKWDMASSGMDNVQALARFYRVSQLVVLIQAFEADLLPRQKYLRMFKAEYSQPKKKPSGGDYYINLFARNGYKFTATVTGALQQGRILYAEAASLLGVKVPTLQKMPNL